MMMLKILPCLDSDDMAAARKRELDIPYDIAAELGQSAVEAAEQGYYKQPDGVHIDWLNFVQAACSRKVSIPPTAVLPAVDSPGFAETCVQVTNETTLGAARRLADRGLKPLALNFANGTHPGGGFLTGALAQEEALCRSSALYQTLLGDPMYQAHLNRPRPDSTAWAIYSPDVPIFRADDGSVLEQPWLLSFITCAAPYAPMIDQPESGDLLQQRIHRVFEIAQAYGYTALILGAWGCGAFYNDTARTARDFRTALETEFEGAFSDVVFAVTDWSPERRFLGPFRRVFR
jgi:uncharacterized protein (TIGR02452 family)